VSGGAFTSQSGARWREALALLAALAACSGCSRRSIGEFIGTSSAASAEQPAPYPHGLWRVASDRELSRTVLWVSHIVVMDRESDGLGLVFRPVGWHPDGPHDRSREEALRIAQRVLREAQADPASFERLARECSDDVVTRDRGGSLGPLSAASMPSAFLDALERTPPGRVSGIVETQLGFHILLRRSPPPREDVAAERIIVRYEGTLSDEPAPKRSRADALRIAQGLIARAKDGVDFSALVDASSEGRDRGRHGFMGVWSTTEDALDGTVVEALSALPVGGVTATPLDTPSGFQVAKRIQTMQTKEVAARVVRVQPDPGTLEDVARAVERVRASRSEVEAHRKTMANLSDVEAIRWFDGHGDPALTTVVERLGIGELEGPFPLHGSQALVERVEPATIASSDTPRYDIPGPEFVDVEAVLAAGNPAALTSALNALGPVFAAARLSHSESAALASGLQRLRADFAADKTPEQRVAAYRANMRELRSDVSEATYSTILDLLQRWLAKNRLEAPRP